MSAHGTPLRGLMSTPRSQTFEGRFGRLFRSLKPASYGKTDADTNKNLLGLGAAMSAAADPADPKDGQDDEESAIPALYTYLGQFIDHDITFGPEGSFQKQKDVDALVDFRTPAFDLDNVYGRGPGDQPYMYDKTGNKFLTGGALKNGSDPNATDLARNSDKPARALIGDPRNDENVIVSQLQGLFHHFHNRVIDEGFSFDDAQMQVRRHYEYVILNDFLPRIIDAGVISALQTNGRYDQHKLQFYHPKKSPFMPVEFSTAAYRFGHSMIRPGYRLNNDDRTLLAIFAASADKDLRGKDTMKDFRGIDWARFIDTEIRSYGPGSDPASAADKQRLQFAYRIDTSLTNPLAGLPPNVVNNLPISLAQRNLLRSVSLGLPSGQAVAKMMQAPVLTDDQILIGKAVTNPSGPDAPKTITQVGSDLNTKAFQENCPLWTYILAEAMQNQAAVTIPVSENVQITSPRLGPVGGRIVAEVFLGIMFGDSTSLLRADPTWTPASGPNYTLKDFVLFATGAPAPAAQTVGA